MSTTETRTAAREDYAKLHANTSGPSHQGQTSREAQAALDEIDRLRQWKREATEVLGEWDRVAAVVERVTPCPLGGSRADHARRFVVGLARRHKAAWL